MQITVRCQPTCCPVNVSSFKMDWLRIETERYLLLASSFAAASFAILRSSSSRFFMSLTTACVFNSL